MLLDPFNRQRLDFGNMTDEQITALAVEADRMAAMARGESGEDWRPPKGPGYDKEPKTRQEILVSSVNFCRAFLIPDAKIRQKHLEKGFTENELRAIGL